MPHVTLRFARDTFAAHSDTDGALLYVSDVGTFTVHVYTYPALKAAGTLTGFDEPQGLCADSAGNVWVTNTNVYEMREYAHGGTAR